MRTPGAAPTSATAGWSGRRWSARSAASPIVWPPRPPRPATISARSSRTTFQRTIDSSELCRPPRRSRRCDAPRSSRMHTQEIVQRLWALCHVLRDDGITYHEYVTELTYLLFLKMMKETGQESQLPKKYRWDDLAGRDGIDQLNFYRALLVHLGTEGSGLVRTIFANAATSLRQPKNLAKLVQDIDDLDW